MKVKVCGITSYEDAVMALDLGVDALPRLQDLELAGDEAEDLAEALLHVEHP